MFTDLFYYMRAKGLKVSMNEWLSLMEALERGLCRNSLLEFYYVSRAILVKTEADFDKFDEIFLDYFDRIQHIEDIPQELMDWLHDPKNMKKYDKIFTPLTVKTMTIKNRVVMPPMGSNFGGANGEITEEHI